MSVSFRCKTSGNIITFSWPADIETTRENPAYEEIEIGLQEEQNSEEKVKKTRKTKEAK